MLIRPTPEQLADFGQPDFIIYNAGQFPANRYTKGMSSTTSVAINFKHMEMVILGTEYAGEMKKGVFSVMVGLLCLVHLCITYLIQACLGSIICNPSSFASFLSILPPMLALREMTLLSSLVSLVLARPLCQRNPAGF